MKFLVLGCNGMLGHMVGLYLQEKGYDVLGFARTKSTLINSVVGDAWNIAFVKDLIRINKFDTIINCIGILNQACEEHKASAVYLNSYFPHELSRLTEGTHTQIIHISTDCVFSGEKGQYTEDDLRDGATFYARTKALGEIVNNKDLTMRQSIIGPDIDQNGIGLLNWFMQNSGGGGYKWIRERHMDGPDFSPACKNY